MSYFDELERVTREANFFNKMNVMDISFDTGHGLEVYVAMDPRSRAHGLRGISELEVDGMLFCFPIPSTAPFTMEGMSMDLDIAWFDEKGLLISKGTFDMNEKLPLICAAPYSYVLETRPGSFMGANLMVATDG